MGHACGQTELPWKRSQRKVLTEEKKFGIQLTSDGLDINLQQQACRNMKIPGMNQEDKSKEKVYSQTKIGEEKD